MKLIEVIVSGKKFKRSHWKHYSGPATAECAYMRDDVLADDWEVEEEKITITKAEFLYAINKICDLLDYENGEGPYLGTSLWEALLTQSQKDKTT